MNIQENVSLAKYTTFKVGGPAKFFCLIKKEDELLEAVKFAEENNLPIFVIGGGSNLLISDSGYSGLVIKLDIRGIIFDSNKVIACAGEDWDDFVQETLNKGFNGLENLSAIPGTVGAAPVQNIGAYGVEVSEIIEEVRVFDTKNHNFISISNKDCQFAYRDSVFKNQKGHFIVVSVTFNLKKDGKVNISYKDLGEYFDKKKISPNPREVREAVIEIRNNKLPDWKKWGTAGSFFKNPIIGIQKYVDLKQHYPDLPGFPDCDGNIKVSLAWILDKVCNAKDLAVGNAFVYEKQALVLVAKPGASASDILELSRKIQDLVKEKTGIVIEAEVEWVN
jgi:UDP-N-acetylmuramate dehydrogenase